MVRILLVFIVFSLINYSCSVKRQTCEAKLDLVFLTKKPENIKVKGIIYVKSMPVLFLFKQSKIKIFTPFGKKLGEFDKNSIPEELSFIKELPITIEEILTAKIYKDKILGIRCENGYVVLQRRNIRFYVKDSKIKYIKWKDYKIKYIYDFDKIKVIILLYKDKTILRIKISGSNFSGI